MDDKKLTPSSGSTWFVGASYGGTDDQMPRFLKEGIWENGYDDKLLDVVRAMQPGERIAIKAAYTRKHGLPFDNRGHFVSVMGIKAIGPKPGPFGNGTSTPTVKRFGVYRLETGSPMR